MKKYKSQLNEQSLNEKQLLEKENNELMKSFSRLLSFRVNDITLAKVVSDSILKAFENSSYENDEVERFARYLNININKSLFV
jgi:hypothetical protein